MVKLPPAGHPGELARGWIYLELAVSAVVAASHVEHMESAYDYRESGFLIFHNFH